MSIRLVSIAAFLTAPEADAARIRLAFSGIAARLDNAALVTWCWHYSNATGGVRLVVAGPDAERAREILFSEDVEEDETPEWTCAACARRVPGPWEICWHCGTSADGRPGAAGDTAEPAAGRIEPESLGCLLVSVVVVGTLATIASLDLIEPMLVIAAAACGVMLVTEATFGRDQPPEAEPPPEETAPEAPVAPDAEITAAGEATAQRAWQAAVFGLIVFPLFTLVSLWLLAKSSPAGARLRRVARWQRGAAWTINLLTVLAWQWVVMALLAGVYDLLWYGYDFFFSLQHMRPPW